MKNKITIINLLSNLFSFFVSGLITMLLSPYIVEAVGVEAYGFVSLANNFVSYLGLVTVALNSVAGRFVSIYLLKNDIDEANQYFSSVVLSNLIIAGIMIVPLSIVIINLEHLIYIPTNLISDVKVLFSVLSLNFLLTVITSIFSVAVFVRNKLYLTSLRNIEANIIKCIFLLVIFYFLPVRVYYIGIATIIVVLYTTYFNIRYTFVLTPELKFKINQFRFTKVRELISSGIWNLISQLSGILNEGLDLLICNLFVGASQMGTLAVAKTIPNLLMSLVFTISGVFSPSLTKSYAEGRTDEIVETMKYSTKVMGFFLSIVIAGLIVFGDSFFMLWMPSEDPITLQILGFLSIVCLTISGSTACIYTIFTVTNKLRLNSLVTLVIGIFNTLTVLFLLNSTNLGVFAIAGVSSLTGILKNLFFTFPYAAKCINKKWYTFYPLAFKSLLSTVLIGIICIIIKSYIPINSWMSLAVAAIISGTSGMLLNLFLYFDFNERKLLFAGFKTILNRKL